MPYYTSSYAPKSFIQKAVVVELRNLLEEMLPIRQPIRELWILDTVVFESWLFRTVEEARLLETIEGLWLLGWLEMVRGLWLWPGAYSRHLGSEGCCCWHLLPCMSLSLSLQSISNSASAYHVVIAHVVAPVPSDYHLVPNNSCWDRTWMCDTLRNGSCNGLCRELSTSLCRGQSFALPRGCHWCSVPGNKTIGALPCVHHQTGPCLLFLVEQLLYYLDQD